MAEDQSPVQQRQQVKEELGHSQIHEMLPKIAKLIEYKSSNKKLKQPESSSNLPKLKNNDNSTAKPSEPQQRAKAANSSAKMNVDLYHLEHTNEVKKLKKSINEILTKPEKRKNLQKLSTNKKLKAV